MKKLWIAALSLGLFFAVQALAAEIPLKIEGGVYTLPVRINGVITLDFTLDSGASEVVLPVDVALTLYRTGTIMAGDTLPEATYTLADGSKVRNPRILIRELEIGGIKIQNVPCSVSSVAASPLLGQSFLKRLDSWTFDNRKKILIVGAQTRRVSDSGGSPGSSAPSQPSMASRNSDVTNWFEPVTGMEFVWVPGGCYQMGCDTWAGDCHADEVPTHKVCVKTFWIGRFEVTQGQWKKLMPKNPSRFNVTDNHPVEQVSWNEVHAYIEKLNTWGGKQYSFRLPTEAEWEYAARSSGKPEKYAGADSPENVAWFSANSDKATHPVGTKLPNGIGLYDMSGNVWEWCADSYAWNAYTMHARFDPIYREPGGISWPVFRGGSWASNAFTVRSFRRGAHFAAHRSLCVGFRLVIELGESGTPAKK